MAKRKKAKKKVSKKTQAKPVKIPRSDQEKNRKLPKSVRDVIKAHRKSVEVRLSEAPLSETLDMHGDRPTVPTDVQAVMTGEDCCEILRAMAHAEPTKAISRNYFRNNSGIKESTWNRHFGTFEEFKRQAGIILGRGAHRLELHLAKHASADVYRTLSEERRTYKDRYDKPTDGRWKTILAFTDVHDVDCDPFTLRVLLDTAKRLDHVIDTVCIGGDLFDLPEFGRFTQDPRDWDVVGRIKFVHDKVLSPLRAALPNQQIDLIEGNHEARLLRHLGDATPALKAVLSDLHGFTVSRLFGLDEWEINYVANGDLAARSWSETEHKKEYMRNWKIYYDCVIAHHFPQGRQKGFPGFHGHHHKHRVWSEDSPLFGAYEWHQLGALHVPMASYTDGEKWNNGFALIHVDTVSKAVQFEYIPVGNSFAVSAGKFYERTEEETNL